MDRSVLQKEKKKLYCNLGFVLQECAVAGKKNCIAMGGWEVEVCITIHCSVL